MVSNITRPTYFKMHERRSHFLNVLNTEFWARSSVGEHCVDIAGVVGSIPTVPTSPFKDVDGLLKDCLINLLPTPFPYHMVFLIVSKLQQHLLACLRSKEGKRLQVLIEGTMLCHTHSMRLTASLLKYEP